MTSVWNADTESRAAKATTPEQQAALAAELGVSQNAVRMVGVQVRKRLGISPHRWTPEEDRRLLAAKTVAEARRIARDIGVVEDRVLERRRQLRSRSGKSVRMHRWTPEEDQEVTSLPSARAAVEWARERGLSENTARSKWYLARWDPRGPQSTV